MKLSSSGRGGSKRNGKRDVRNLGESLDLVRYVISAGQACGGRVSCEGFTGMSLLDRREKTVRLLSSQRKASRLIEAAIAAILARILAYM